MLDQNQHEILPIIHNGADNSFYNGRCGKRVVAWITLDAWARGPGRTRAIGVVAQPVRGMIDQACVTINGEPCASGAAGASGASGAAIVAVGEVIGEVIGDVIGDVVSIRFDPTQRYRVKMKLWDDRSQFNLYTELSVGTYELR